MRSEDSCEEFVLPRIPGYCWWVHTQPFPTCKTTYKLWSQLCIDICRVYARPWKRIELIQLHPLICFGSAFYLKANMTSSNDAHGVWLISFSVRGRVWTQTHGHVCMLYFLYVVMRNGRNRSERKMRGILRRGIFAGSHIFKLLTCERFFFILVKTQTINHFQWKHAMFLWILQIFKISAFPRCWCWNKELKYLAFFNTLLSSCD